MEIRGSSALVTGAGRGIGRSIAKALAAGTALAKPAGANTYLVAFSPSAPVAQFLVTSGTSLDSKNVLYSVLATENVPVTATVGVAPSGSQSAIQSIALQGNGGFIQTQQSIKAISSTGWPGPR